MSVKNSTPSAREKAIEAYDNARESAATAGRKAGDGIDQAPLVALAGGLAIGALLAALLPKTTKESELLGGVGGRLTDTARTAAEAAKDAGKARLEELGLTRDAGAETLRSILKGAGDATKASAQAAISAVRDTK
jgi:hypothetical protein